LHFVFIKIKEEITELSLKKCLKNTYYKYPEIAANEMLLKEYLGKLLKIAPRNSTCCYFKTLY
jgi:hypothetical protein